MRQWQCPACLQWIGAGWWRHSHLTFGTVSVDDMIAARMRGEVDPLSHGETTVNNYMRTGKEPTREEPDGNP